MYYFAAEVGTVGCFFYNRKYDLKVIINEDDEYAVEACPKKIEKFNKLLER